MKKVLEIMALIGMLTFGITGCQKVGSLEDINVYQKEMGQADNYIKQVEISSDITQLEEGLSAVVFEGNDGFEQFLQQGGAASDADVVSYLTENLLGNIPDLLLGKNPFGCSAFLVKSDEEGYCFGRNFDWNRCNALIIKSLPETGYASISTVNTDFVQAGRLDISSLPDMAQAIIGLYAPLDGINEKGLAVSVNMIQDSASINQNTERKDITTTTAVRLLLNKAANVEEAVRLLEEYDLHASMNMMIHFALADAEGNSVVVEYIDNEMVVTDAAVVTNFYLTEGEKYGIGTAQSHKRYEIIEEALQTHESMSLSDVRNTLDSVSKDNFNDGATTEWSIIMDLTKGEATYFHRENYNSGYTFSLRD